MRTIFTATPKAAPRHVCRGVYRCIEPDGSLIVAVASVRAATSPTSINGMAERAMTLCFDRRIDPPGHHWAGQFKYDESLLSRRRAKGCIL